jgi:hypothetical protein
MEGIGLMYLYSYICKKYKMDKKKSKIIIYEFLDLVIKYIKWVKI